MWRWRCCRRVGWCYCLPHAAAGSSVLPSLLPYLSTCSAHLCIWLNLDLCFSARPAASWHHAAFHTVTAVVGAGVLVRRSSSSTKSCGPLARLGLDARRAVLL